MNKPIVVYWTVNAPEWMRAKEPHPIYNSEFLKEYTQEIGLNMCPSFKNHMKNIFGIRSLYTYDFSIAGDNIVSDKYDQKFFDYHVSQRSIKNKCFSFDQHILFFTEEKSLNMNIGLYPFFEQNEITKRCMTIPGKMDIGKWFRSTDFAFFLKNEYTQFFINEDDIYQYIKFDTDRKIIFKQFYLNPFLLNQLNSVSSSKFNRPRSFRKIEEYYSMLKNKDRIIKEIKENLI